MAVLKNLVMRGASQRLGGMVLYQLKGQTLARELAPAVSNPRTPAQMDNRVRLQNVVSVYRANRAWMPGAFENKKERESDYNAFVSANLSSSQVAFTKQQAAAGAAVAAPYQISSGSLNSIEQKIAEAELQTNIYLGTLTISPVTTVGDFAAAVINNNNGIIRGMQLSLIVNIQQVNNTTGIPYILTRAFEVILDPDSTATLQAFMPEISNGDVGGGVNAVCYDLSGFGSGAVSFILSHTSSAITRVSEQSLLMFGDQAVYDSYTSPAAIAAAVESYGENQINFLDSNSAEAGSVVPVAQGIQVVSYGGLLIRPGGEIATDFLSSLSMYVYVAQPIDVGANVAITMTNVTASEAVLMGSVTMPNSRQQARVNVTSDYSVDTPSVMRLTITIDGESYSMQFTMLPNE